MKEKLALFSPLPPTKSGIADYSVELAGALNEFWDIIHIIADDAPEPESIPDSLSYCRCSAWNETDTKNVPRFYHMGNNVHHEYIFREILSHPGVTLMHDYSMHHLMVELTLARGDELSYVEMMEEQYGLLGKRLAELRLEYVHDDIVQFMLPLNKQVIDNSLGLVVHSNYSLRELSYQSPEKACCRVSFPYEIPDPKLVTGSKELAREILSIRSDRIIFSSFGFVTPPKQVELTLRALAESKDVIPTFEFIIVGEVSESLSIGKLAEELGLSEMVKVTGYVSFEQFHHYIEASDVILSLRYPSAGETSAALMRAMGLGRANIVFDYASYPDFPDDAVFKIPLDTYNTDHLKEAIIKLANDSEYRDLIGNNAMEHLNTQHGINVVAKEMTDFIRTCFRNN